MAEISAERVKELREKTGAGMMDCKKALSESSGDLEKAIEILRKKGLKDVGKRSGKTAAEGTVLSYIHSGGRIGVLLELNCETDFVARGTDFSNAAREIAMHVAWAKPRFLSREEVPTAVLEKEREIFASQLKPEQQKAADKILVGKIEKFYEENCLLEQLDARSAGGKRKIQDILNDLSAKVGEKIVLRRFVRFEVGEGIEKQATDYAAEVAAVLQQ
jgi:elongation factor Ts